MSCWKAQIVCSCEYSDIKSSRRGDHHKDNLSVHEKFEPFKCEHCETRLSQKGNHILHELSEHM